MEWVILGLFLILAVLILITVRMVFERLNKYLRRKKRRFYLNRSGKNPIISPNRSHNWESEATFNPAVIKLADRVHVLYQAIGSAGVGTIGYAGASDGLTFSERLPFPIYPPAAGIEGVNQVAPVSSGGDSPVIGDPAGRGAENPKVAEVDGRIYMTFTLSDARERRIGLTSIGDEDFLAKRWNWSQFKIISRPGETNEDAVILPEKIKGKYVIFHHLSPNISIDYVDSLNFENGGWLEAKETISVRPGSWDSRRMRIAATPIKTELGWLAIYQAVDEKDPASQKIGAMILDIDNPGKVLFRANQPLLNPNMSYENDWKPGSVCPGGAVITGNNLNVYYGSGEKTVSVAAAPIGELLHYLKHQ
jgi:predicted GH43/DUF377 family glycosyl hydrolase